MHQYTVVDATPDGRLLALLDASGRFHIVRANVEGPAIRSVLLGLRPWPGQALLLDQSAGTVFRVNFEHVDMDQLATLRRLHPSALQDEPSLGGEREHAWRRAPACARASPIL